MLNSRIFSSVDSEVSLKSFKLMPYSKQGLQMLSLGSEKEEKMRHRCDVGDMHPKAIAILVDAMDRIRQSVTGGCLGAQTEWFQNTCVPLPYV